MLKPNKSKNPNQLRIGADLTPSQLVLAICVFLCAALICFSLGVIVGKYDERNSSKEKERLAMKVSPPQANQPPFPVRAAPGKPPVIPAATPPKNMDGAVAKPAGDTAGASGVSGSGQGVQTSPRPIMVPPSPAKPGYPGSPGAGTGSVQAGPRVSEHPAPPKPGSGDSTGAATPPATEPAVAPQAAPPADATKEKPVTDTAPAPKAGSAAVANAPDGAPKTDKPKDAANTQLAALEPLTPPAAPANVPAAATATATAAPKPVTAETKKGLYTIQLVALSSATRKEQGLAMKKKLEAEGLQPEVLMSKDGARVTVVVGSYPDRQSAQAACNELRKKNGFSGSFVRTR